VHVVSSFVDGDTPSTRTAVEVLARLSDRRHVLVVLERADETTWKSLRNVERAHILVADQLNTYDVLCSDDVVFTEAALRAFLGESGAEPAEKPAEVEAEPAAKKPAKQAAEPTAAASTVADEEGEK
jgi:large subunit ribosomal protein L4